MAHMIRASLLHFGNVPSTHNTVPVYCEVTSTFVFFAFDRATRGGYPVGCWWWQLGRRLCWIAAGTFGWLIVFTSLAYEFGTHSVGLPALHHDRETCLSTRVHKQWAKNFLSEFCCVHTILFLRQEKTGCIIYRWDWSASFSQCVCKIDDLERIIIHGSCHW